MCTRNCYRRPSRTHALVGGGEGSLLDYLLPRILPPLCPPLPHPPNSLCSKTLAVVASLIMIVRRQDKFMILFDAFHGRRQPRESVTYGCGESTREDQTDCVCGCGFGSGAAVRDGLRAHACTTFRVSFVDFLETFCNQKGYHTTHRKIKCTWTGTTSPRAFIHRRVKVRKRCSPPPPFLQRALLPFSSEEATQDNT